jgi:outer membrane lipoprotein-sorting protein
MTGCAVRGQRDTKYRVTTASLKEASLQELVNVVNTSAAHLQTLNATVEIDASSGGERKGKVTDYRQVSGYVLVRKPEMLRMILLAPVVRSRLVDMVSDGKKFELAITTPSQSKFYVGSNQQTGKPSPQPLENMRPQHIFDALLLKPIDGEDELAVLEQSTELVKDPKTKKDAIEPDYIVVVIRRDQNGSYLSRKIVFSRQDLLPHEQYIYNRLGELVTYARYENFTDYGGTMFPSLVQIQRPVEEYAITLTMVKLRLNEPLTNDQFVLTQPPGSKLINLDERTTSAGNQPSRPSPEADNRK